MDDPEQNPDFYRDENTKTALEDTEEFILAVKNLAKTTKQGVYPLSLLALFQAVQTVP